MPPAEVSVGDTKHNGQNVLSFWTICCPFTPLPLLNTQNIEILKKWKKARRYYHFTQVHHKWQSHDKWFLRYEAWQTIFCHFELYFDFYPSNNLKNQNFEKMKKKPGDIILPKCTINENPVMYDSWNMKRDRQIFLSFWTISCPFASLTTRKIKILKKWKKQLEFWAIFYPFISLTAQTIKILKKWKKTPGDIIILQ